MCLSKSGCELHTQKEESFRGLDLQRTSFLEEGSGVGEPRVSTVNGNENDPLCPTKLTYPWNTQDTSKHSKVGSRAVQQARPSRG